MKLASRVLIGSQSILTLFFASWAVLEYNSNLDLQFWLASNNLALAWQLGLIFTFTFCGMCLAVAFNVQQYAMETGAAPKDTVVAGPPTPKAVATAPAIVRDDCPGKELPDTGETGDTYNKEMTAQPLPVVRKVPGTDLYERVSDSTN